jgi:Mg/Co/Ni transporter MgtE
MAISKTVAGTWAVDFRDQHKRRILRTFDTHKQAADFEKDVLAQVAKREYVKPSDKTVREVADEWRKRKADAGSYRRASLVDWKTTSKTTSSRNWAIASSATSTLRRSRKPRASEASGSRRRWSTRSSRP